MPANDPRRAVSHSMRATCHARSASPDCVAAPRCYAGSRAVASKAPGKNVNMYVLGLFFSPLGKEL